MKEELLQMHLISMLLHPPIDDPLVNSVTHVCAQAGRVPSVCADVKAAKMAAIAVTFDADNMVSKLIGESAGFGRMGERQLMFNQEINPSAMTQK